MIVSQAKWVWEFVGENLLSEHIQDFIDTGRMGDGEEPVLPYNPAIMEEIAKGRWSVGDGK